MGIIPRPPLLKKDEFKREEASGLERVRPDLIGPRHLVSCPKDNFSAMSTAGCVACGFCLGFFPRDRRKPLEPGNAWVVCTHPMGREITSV